MILGACCCSPPFRFLGGELLLKPLGFCWRTVHGRKPKPSLRAARVTSSSVNSPLGVLCTAYNPSLTCAHVCLFQHVSQIAHKRLLGPVTHLMGTNTIVFVVPHCRVPHGISQSLNCQACFDQLRGMRAVPNLNVFRELIRRFIATSRART